MKLNSKGDLREMLFFDRRRRKKRGFGKDRREVEDPDYKGPEKQNGRKWGRDRDRRSGVDRRTGMYHTLPEDQKNTVDAILANLEKLLDQKKE
jgi:hypothetical protein